MKIEELIDRYFEGQTSCDEERELRRFFTQENIPESLQVYRPLFACLAQEAKAFRKESIPAKKLSFRRRFIYMTGGIAADYYYLSALQVHNVIFMSLRITMSSSTVNNTPMRTSYVNKPLQLSAICGLRRMKYLT